MIKLQRKYSVVNKALAIYYLMFLFISPGRNQ